MSYNITTVMKRLDGSIGESKATFADGEVTFEQSDTPSPYDNCYTKDETDELLANKADKVNTYTKAETDTAIQTAINNAILTALNTAV